jgi:hypothetical protein
MQERVLDRGAKIELPEPAAATRPQTVADSAGAAYAGIYRD